MAPRFRVDSHKTTTSHEHHTPGETPQHQPDRLDRATSRNRSEDPGEGLRISEALNLRVPDIDEDNDLLMIKAAKSHERFVPVHPSTTTALQQYIALPARMATRPDPAGPVFVTDKGTGYIYVSFQHLFKRLRDAAGLAPRGRARPRLHDLRHTFATAHMTAAYAHSGDPDRVLSLLATWLGHSDATHTYWYLTATGELMALAAGKLESISESEKP